MVTLAIFGLILVLAAIARLVTTRQLRDRGTITIGRIDSTRESRSGEGTSYYAVVKFSDSSGRQHKGEAQLRDSVGRQHKKGAQTLAEALVDSPVEVHYVPDKPQRFRINSDLFAKSYRSDVSKGRHVVTLLVGLAMLAPWTVSLVTGESIIPTTTETPTMHPSDVVKNAAIDACGDGTMTSDDLAAYKAVLEELAIDPTSVMPRATLSVFCGVSYEDAERWLP